MCIGGYYYSPVGCIGTINCVAYLFVGMAWLTCKHTRAGIFKQSMVVRKRVGIGLPYRPVARLHIGWRNSFLGIDSWAP